MNDRRDPDHTSRFDDDIRSAIHRAAASVDVPDRPAAVHSGRRGRRDTSRTRRTLAIGLVAAAAALVAGLIVADGPPSRLNAVAPAGGADERTEDRPDDEESSTTTAPESTTTLAPSAPVVAIDDATVAAFEQLALPAVSLTTRTADFSNPWVAPPVEFELPAGWDGSTEFTESGGGSGGLGFSSDGDGPNGRFVLATWGVFERPGEAVPARDGSTWAVTTVELDAASILGISSSTELVAAVSEAIDGNVAVIFGGLERAEWEHALRSTTAAHGINAEVLPNDLAEGWRTSTGAARTERTFVNARGPDLLFLGVDLSDNDRPLWADAVATDVARTLSAERSGPGPISRCDPAADVTVCASLEPDHVGTEIVVRLSAWRAGLRVDATLPVRTAAGHIGAHQLQDTVGLLGSVIDAIRIPVR